MLSDIAIAIAASLESAAREQSMGHDIARVRAASLESAAREQSMGHDIARARAASVASAAREQIVREQSTGRDIARVSAASVASVASVASAAREQSTGRDIARASAASVASAAREQRAREQSTGRDIARVSVESVESGCNYLDGLPLDKQYALILATSAFEAGELGLIDNPTSKPLTRNLGGDITLVLNGQRVCLVQQCFVLCLQKYLKDHNHVISDQYLADTLCLDTTPNCLPARGKPFTNAQIEKAAIDFRMTIEVYDVLGVKRFNPDRGTHIMKLWLEVGHYELIVE